MHFNSMKELLEARDSMRADWSAIRATEQQAPLPGEVPLPSHVNRAALNVDQQRTLSENWVRYLNDSKPLMEWTKEDKAAHQYYLLRALREGGY